MRMSSLYYYRQQLIGHGHGRRRPRRTELLSPRSMSTRFPPRSSLSHSHCFPSLVPPLRPSALVVSLGLGLSVPSTLSLDCMRSDGGAAPSRRFVLRGTVDGR